VLLSLVSLIVLFPVWMTLVRALSSQTAYNERLKDGAPLIPVQPDWGVFGDSITQGNLWAAFGQSMLMSVVITVAQVVTAVAAAYAFTFLKFPFKRILFAVFLATMMLPLEVTFIANNQTIRGWGWNDTLAGLVAPFLATAFGTFLLRQGFMGIPSELREATFLDGYGHFNFLWRFAVPLTKPVVASFVLISFLTAWNQYLWPRTVIEKESSNTLQLAIRTLTVEAADRANVAIAGAIVASIPILLLLLVFQRQIVRGLTAGAVKG
jgi:sn-glycerol 3-phosphate transport system permease protein